MDRQTIRQWFMLTLILQAISLYPVYVLNNTTLIYVVVSILISIFTLIVLYISKYRKPGLFCFRYKHNNIFEFILAAGLLVAGILYINTMGSVMIVAGANLCIAIIVTWVTDTSGIK